MSYLLFSDGASLLAVLVEKPGGTVTRLLLPLSDSPPRSDTLGYVILLVSLQPPAQELYSL